MRRIDANALLSVYAQRCEREKVTKTDAEKIMKSVGCLDTRNAACLHIARCHYIDRVGRGECQEQPVRDAYELLLEDLKKPPAVTQGALFSEKMADL